ncbi:MAG: LapA family protein, partial [Pseudomonadota bacterium]
LSEVYAYSIDLPLFVVSLASIGLGLVLGYVIEYLREGKHRQMARRKRREAEQLANEVTALRKRHLSEEDEVLAILESAGKNA